MATRSFISAAAAPLVSTARALDWPRRQAFLNDLRSDAPSLVAEVERELRTLSTAETPPVMPQSSSTIVRACLACLHRLSPRLPH